MPKLLYDAVNYPLLESFHCPIIGRLMIDPVTKEDGHTYEKFAIRKWQKTKKNSPFTRENLNENFRTNVLTKKLIEKTLEEYNLISFDQFYQWVLEDRAKLEKVNYLDIYLDHLKYHHVSIVQHAIKTDLELLKWLINECEETDLNDRVGNSPLIIACQQLNIKAVKLLIENNIDPNTIGHEQTTALHELCNEANKLSTSLNSHTANTSNLLAIRNENKKNCAIKIIDILLEAGANVFASNKSHKMPQDLFAHSTNAVAVYLKNRTEELWNLRHKENKALKIKIQTLENEIKMNAEQSSSSLLSSNSLFSPQLNNETTPSASSSKKRRHS